MPWGPEGSGLRACPAPPRMLQSVRELEATSSGAGAKAAAFQHLLLLVGIYLFKVWMALGVWGTTAFLPTGRGVGGALGGPQPEKSRSVHLMASCVLSSPCGVSDL